jgi:hypothetical protein
MAPHRTVDRKLLDKARRSPHALTFDEALRLGRQLGFEKVRQVRGHRVFRHAVLSPLNLQESRGGHAKVYQVRRMLQLSKGLGHV